MVKLSSLGDVIQTLPVLHDIHSWYPQAEIDWVVEESFAELLRSVPSLSRVIPIAQRRWRKQPWSRASRAGWADFWTQLHQCDYDAVIDFQGLLKSARVARGAHLTATGWSSTFGNASALCAYEWPVRWLLGRSVPMPLHIHAVARCRYLAAHALGHADSAVWHAPPVYPWPQSGARPRAATTAHALRPTLVFAHGTTRMDNQWAVEKWQALGHCAMQAGFALALPQANDAEQLWGQRLQSALGDDCVVWPRMGLEALRQHMASAAGVVGVDSGLGHLAVALGLPVVQIFSQPRIQRAGPVGQAHQTALGGDHVPSAAQVWAAFQGCLHAAPLSAKGI